jgi:hypothetical protein
VRESYLASQMRNPIHPGFQNITYFDSQPDVAIIRSEKYSLRTSEECFAGEAWMIVGSLVSLDYARLLTEHKRLLLGRVPHRARSDLPCVATLGDWYLLIWPN